jgi:hypothetical protein
VAVLGNGSSGLQIVPAIQPQVGKLVNYVRQPTWVSINFLSDKTPEGVNFKYSEEQKKAWREDPTALFEYRKELEQGCVSGCQTNVAIDETNNPAESMPSSSPCGECIACLFPCPRP